MEKYGYLNTLLKHSQNIWLLPYFGFFESIKWCFYLIQFIPEKKNLNKPYRLLHVFQVASFSQIIELISIFLVWSIECLIFG